MNKIHTQAKQVLDFWFDPANQPFWFAKSDEFDERIKDEFGELIKMALAGELWAWRQTLGGRLAEILILDQFTRNVYRGTPKAFAGDGMALVLAQEAVVLTGFDELPTPWQKFIAMPFMHSESLTVHERAVEIFRQIGDAETLDFEYQHQVIIQRFGRYPHRNAILGRVSTPDEVAFLSEPNSSF
ncbi:MAG: DUF924 family protein [Moraxella sp.]|nr:DUF924 family protein [Moraxella sp.]